MFDNFFFSKHKVFITSAILFAAGIYCASLPGMVMLYSYGIMGFGILLWGLGGYFGWRRVAVSGFLIAILGFGAWRYQVSKTPSEYAGDFDQKISFEGIIVEDPDIRTNMQMLTIRPFDHRQNVLARVRLQDKYLYGDWVAVSGKIAEPENFSDFDYQGYLERFNVYATMSYPKVLILKNHRGNAVKDALLQTKHILTNRLARLLPEPENSLLLGILIGAKKTLPASVVNDFNATGTSHVIAVSGFNISIIISSLMFLAYLLGRRGHFWFCLCFIVAFVIMAGASASVVRAAVMGALCLIALRSGRQYAALGSLFFAALAMLVLNPKILLFDIGFQLSFAATLGIVLFVPLLSQADESSWWGIKDTLLTTLAAIAATLPLSMHYFGTVSIVAPIVNILIVPLLVPATMLLGFLAVLPWIGPGFAFVSKYLLYAMLFIVHAFSSIPHASVQANIPAWTAACMYAILGAGFVYWKRKAHGIKIKRNN